MTRARIAVLASGGGSNLQALLDYFASLGERRAGDVVLVASDRADSGALARARHARVATAVIATSRNTDGQSLDAVLSEHGIDLVVLAGYLQLVPSAVTTRFAGRMLNVHPGPLPEFGGHGMYGARVHRSVLTARAALTGPTVHFVDDVYDHGAPIAHWPVPVLPGDDERTLAARVLRAEHLLFPRVVQAVASGRVMLDDEGQMSRPLLRSPEALPPFDPDRDDATLGRALDAAFAIA